MNLKGPTDLCHEMSSVVAAVYGLCTATSTVFFFGQMQPDYEFERTVVLPFITIISDCSFLIYTSDF